MPPFAAQISNSYLKYLAFPESPPPSFSYKDWEFKAEGFEWLGPLGEVYNATDPNIDMIEPRRRKEHEGREKKKKLVIAIFSWWLSKCRRRSKKDCFYLPIPNI
ncbi:hypothetical protein [Microcoleus sp. MON1_C1]|uniref:hypothetical protein n=1 Tax=Microcoleus sp. MON1_C1 TaxID=2818827 RepID=UPI0040407077